jgi:hypothetical protein
MGRELMRFDSFRAELIRAGCYLKGLGCSWSVMGKYLLIYVDIIPLPLAVFHHAD